MSPQSAAVPFLPPKNATVDLFGKKISWDALIVAGAGLAGVLFLYKFGQSGQLSPMSTVAPSGGAGDATSMSTVPAAPPQQAINAYAGPLPSYDPTGFAPSAAPPGSAPQFPSAPAQTTIFAPVQASVTSTASPQRTGPVTGGGTVIGGGSLVGGAGLLGPAGAAAAGSTSTAPPPPSPSAGGGGSAMLTP